MEISSQAQISEQSLGPNQRKGNTKITPPLCLCDIDIQHDLAYGHVSSEKGKKYGHVSSKKGKKKKNTKEGQHDLQGLQLGRQPTTDKGPLGLQGSQPGGERTEAVVTGGDEQPQLEDHIVVNIPDPDPEAEDMSYAGWLSFLENFILGPNQRNQIWRLRLLSGTSLYIAAVAGSLFYLDVPKAQAPYHYQRVMLITSVGAPISVAAFSLFVSFWLASVPNRRSNWVTGLSVANFIMLCGPLPICWAHKWGTGN